MYIKKISIKHVKSIDNLTIEFDTPYKGWHVLLGDNGAGKSSILKMISLCFLGDKQGYALQQNFKSWITKGKEKATCEMDLIFDSKQDFLSEVYEGIKFYISISKEGELKFELKGADKELSLVDITSGWYSAAFGPFRRIGTQETKSVDFLHINLSNHITLFDPTYNLTEAVQWLKDLKFEELSTKKNNSFDTIVSFINNTELLPNNVKIEKVNHEGVFFVDGTNKDISINELSDGYQSVFSLTLEILRQISRRFKLKEVIKEKEYFSCITATGVILIDEVDVHLHPQWQAKIGEWFKRYFPNIQFIVSTHSPIICQSADPGSIWKIEHSKTDKPSKRITGQAYKRMVYGSITDAIGTDNFGEERIERSDKSKEMLERLALLNMKSIRGLATKEEEKERKDLKSILPSED